MSILIIGALAGSVVALAWQSWVTQRNDLHLRWDLEARYAQQFLLQTDDTFAELTGLDGSWSNTTLAMVDTLLSYADTNIQDIAVLDRAHANQLSSISYGLQGLRVSYVIGGMNSSQRTVTAAQVYSLGVKIAHAYWNFLNYTGETPGVGPPFWYSGPAPPDEAVLQQAYNIALGFPNRP